MKHRLSKELRDVLLKEYELSQTAAFAIDKSLWNYVLLIDGAQIALLVPIVGLESGMVYGIFAIGSLIAYWSLVQMIKVNQYYIHEKFARCREIESQLRMNAHTRIDAKNFRPKPKTIIVALSAFPAALAAAFALMEYYRTGISQFIGNNLGLPWGAVCGLFFYILLIGGACCIWKLGRTAA